MKDKLRELAERWRVEYSGIAGAEIGTVHMTQCICAAELLAILDAEGDGGAVDEPRFFIDHTMIHDRVTGKHVTCDPDFRDYEINPGETTRINNPDGISNTCALLNNLAAHPARSGVVSDEAWVVRSTSGNDFFYRDEKQALTTFHALMGSTISRFVQQEKAK